jgi:hypothetical protein
MVDPHSVQIVMLRSITLRPLLPLGWLLRIAKNAPRIVLDAKRLHRSVHTA